MTYRKWPTASLLCLILSTLVASLKLTADIAANS